MIQRLVDVLRRLAAPAAGAAPGALAGDLADALLLVDSCQQERIDAGTREGLDALERLLESLPPDAGTLPEEVRRLAIGSLQRLGQE